MGEYEHVLLKREKGTVTITMNRASRRNSLSADHLAELLAAFRETGKTDASGIVLAGAGPVFCAGHDFGDVAARDPPSPTCCNLRYHKSEDHFSEIGSNSRGST